VEGKNEAKIEFRRQKLGNRTLVLGGGRGTFSRRYIVKTLSSKVQKLEGETLEIIGMGLGSALG